MSVISIDKLISWGLFKQVKKEEIVDSKIKNIIIPKNEKMETIVEKWMINNGIKSNDSLNIWLKNKGLDVEQWKKLVLRDHKWRIWCHKKFEKDLPSYYLKRKPLLDFVTYSLVRVKEEDLALELFLRIKEDEADFREISNIYSEGPESKTGGLIGPVTLKQTHPMIAKILLISQSKQLWAPKKIDDWWVILRLEKLTNTDFNEDIAKYLSFELGEQFLNKETDNIEKLNLKHYENNIKKK